MMKIMFLEKIIKYLFKKLKYIFIFFFLFGIYNVSASSGGYFVSTGTTLGFIKDLNFYEFENFTSSGKYFLNFSSDIVTGEEYITYSLHPTVDYHSLYLYKISDGSTTTILSGNAYNTGAKGYGSYVYNNRLYFIRFYSSANRTEVVSYNLLNSTYSTIYINATSNYNVNTITYDYDLNRLYVGGGYSTSGFLGYINIVDLSYTSISTTLKNINLLDNLKTNQDNIYILRYGGTYLQSYYNKYTGALVDISSPPTSSNDYLYMINNGYSYLNHTDGYTGINPNLVCEDRQLIRLIPSTYNNYIGSNYTITGSGGNIHDYVYSYIGIGGSNNHIILKDFVYLDTDEVYSVLSSNTGGYIDSYTSIAYPWSDESSIEFYSDYVKGVGFFTFYCDTNTDCTELTPSLYNLDDNFIMNVEFNKKFYVDFKNGFKLKVNKNWLYNNLGFYVDWGQNLEQSFTGEVCYDMVENVTYIDGEVYDGTITNEGVLISSGVIDISGSGGTDTSLSIGTGGSLSGSISIILGKIKVNESGLDQNCLNFLSGGTFAYLNPEYNSSISQFFEAGTLINLGERRELKVFDVNLIGWMYDIVNGIILFPVRMVSYIPLGLFNIIDDYISVVSVPDRGFNYCFFGQNYYLDNNISEYYSYNENQNKQVNGLNNIEIMVIFVLSVIIMLYLAKR